MNSEAMPKTTGTEVRAASHPGFAEAFRFWLKLGFISFGGPTGQIAIMHAELVERRRWRRKPGAPVLNGPSADCADNEPGIATDRR